MRADSAMLHGTIGGETPPHTYDVLALHACDPYAFPMPCDTMLIERMVRGWCWCLTSRTKATPSTTGEGIVAMLHCTMCGAAPSLSIAHMFVCLLGLVAFDSQEINKCDQFTHDHNVYVDHS